MDKLNTIITKLDREILKFRPEEASTLDAALQETRDPKASEQLEDENNHLNSHDPLEFDSRPKQDAEDGDDGSHTAPSPDTRQASDSRFCSPVCNEVEEKGEELVVKSQGSEDESCVSEDSRTDFVEEISEKVKGKEETNKEWITVG